MREIKFRAYDKKEKKWLMGYEFPSLGGFSMFGECMMMGEWASLLSSYFPDRLKDIEVMQFTGLKDKNGKEIYSSDFVGVSKEKYGEVYWNEDELAWWIEPIGEYPCEPLRGKGDAVEVLGNKYEGLV